jgi:hypothetical protein
VRTPIRIPALDAIPCRGSRLGKTRCALAAAAAAATLCGCSLSLPSNSPALGIDYEATGSIAKPAPAPAPPAVSPLSRKLDAEDWRRAKAALGVALDPQGNGSTVAWANPQTGRRGSFVPVAAPYPVDGQVCRAFIARIDGDPHEHVQGAACRIGATDDWDLMDVKPFKNG